MIPIIMHTIGTLMFLVSIVCFIMMEHNRKKAIENAHEGYNNALKMKKEAEKMSDTESVDWWDKEVNHWKERLEWWHTTAFYDALILLGVSTGLFLLIWVMF